MSENKEMTLEERKKLETQVTALFAGEERADEMELLASTIGDADPDYLADIAAYIRVAQATGKHPIEIQFNVAHDLCQYGRACFLPRTQGYAKREQEGR